MDSAIDYDEVAPSYDQRYSDRDYPGVSRELTLAAEPHRDVLEVGCGTGHWLSILEGRGKAVTGLDLSIEMLSRARACDVTVAQGSAEALPFRDGAFDLLIVINAVHHFPDKPAFIAEARRVLRPGGGVFFVGLDPSRGQDEWYVYDHFPGTLQADLTRYPATDAISEWLSEAGFVEVVTTVAEPIVEQADARTYLEAGRLTKTSTSQLALLTDHAFDAGVERIWSEISAAESGGGCFSLSAALKLFGTSARLPA